MFTLPHYHIQSQIYEDAYSSVYRGIRIDDQQAVIFKVLKEDYPSPEKLARYRQEYEIMRELDQINGVVKAYSLEKYQSTLVIVLEDFGGKSLRSWMVKEQGLTVKEFLPLAIQMADSLGHIHAANVIHKDINPSNIVWNPNTSQLKFIDFGMASRLPRENPMIKSPEQLEGTLAYISPEQTGRMNRVLDYRTDLYSLGVTFYELLTGHLPFETTDAMELVHCHLAKLPPPPQQFNLEIPQVLSNLLLHLLAKNAEERYQSAWGGKADLVAILERLETEKTLHGYSFELKQQDVSNYFHLPQKLYGREQEIEILWQAFERVSQGATEFLLIAGYSGIGKTSVVQEIYKPITAKRGYFITGKFDQLQRNIPYSALLQAFRHFIQQLLTESATSIQRWQQQLLAAVGKSGQVIIEVIPEVELLLGKQPAVPTLSPTESQNRFNRVFQNFIQACCQPKHPLVIFLDDLQWVDSASLKLMTLMMSDIPYLFLIGAYRDNEVTSTHPLVTTLNEMRQTAVVVQTVTLSPLTLPHIVQFLADTLNLATDQEQFEKLHELGQMLSEKTGGNPFFLGEFVKTLYAENLLQFDPQQQHWSWDVVQIQAHNITDNVVELMVSKIQQLSPTVQMNLKLAAALGNRFEAATLATVGQQHLEHVHQSLWEAQFVGLIIKIGEVYRFVHDRVQQAAYSLIPEAEQPALHWQIGQLLLNNLGGGTENIPDIENIPDLEKYIFEIVDHLNVGWVHTTALDERRMLARLNRLAGKKARQSAAYSATLKYLDIAVSCLEADSWQQDYDFTLDLYKAYAEAEFLNSHFEQSAQLIAWVEEHVNTPLEKAEILLLLVVQRTIEAQYIESINIARRALKLLGLDLPTSETVGTALQEVFAEVKTCLGDREILSLSDAPENQNPVYRLATQLYISLDPPTYIIGDLNLYTYVSVKAVALSLQYGNVTESAKGYANYGLIVGSGLGDFKTGYQFGMLAVAVSKKFQSLAYECQVDLLLGSWIHSWNQPLREAKQYNLDGYHAGMASGEVQFASYNIFGYIANSWVEGSPLATTQHRITEYLPIINKTKNDLTTDTVLGIQLTGLFLMGKPRKVIRYNKTLSEAQYREHCVASPLGFATYCTFNAQCFYILEQAEMALSFLESVQPILGSIFGFTASFEYNFYHSLVLLALFDQVSDARRQEYLQTVTIQQTQLKTWADSCPDNFLHKWLLVEAERARLNGKICEAINLYEQAIRLSGQGEFVQDQALANELIGKFWLANGQIKYAKVHLVDAYYGYQCWGAEAKIEQLEQKYPQFFVQKPTLRRGTSGHDILTQSDGFSSTQNTMLLDVQSLIKFSQTLLGERNLTQLLNKMMSLVVENAGAQIGFLLLPEEPDQWLIQAHIDYHGLEVLQAVPFIQTSLLAHSVIQYVCRTRESVVLDRATYQGYFTQDPHIIEGQVHSLLCIPLLNQGQLSGILYLENNLVQGAFTPDRVETLRLLSSQLAISIENALLYEQLEHKVAQRTAELATANQEIVSLNQRLQSENLRMSTELEVSRHLQQLVLPRSSELKHIQDLDIAAYMEPADEVGGDYYDVLQHQGIVKIGIGDVTGHGLESGILMLMTQMAARTLLTNALSDPVQFLNVLNQALYNNIQRMNLDKNLTLCFVDYQEGKVRISGQHEDILIMRQDGHLESIDTTSLGFFVGVKANISNFLGCREVILNPGDGMVLYTDGITEALNQHGQPYGIERLRAVVRQTWLGTAAQVQQAVFKDVYQHIGEQSIADDMTVLVLKRR